MLKLRVQPQTEKGRVLDANLVLESVGSKDSRTIRIRAEVSPDPTITAPATETGGVVWEADGWNDAVAASNGKPHPATTIPEKVVVVETPVPAPATTPAPSPWQSERRRDISHAASVRDERAKEVSRSLPTTPRAAPPSPSPRAVPTPQPSSPPVRPAPPPPPPPPPSEPSGFDFETVVEDPPAASKEPPPVDPPPAVPPPLPPLPRTTGRHTDRVLGEKAVGTERVVRPWLTSGRVLTLGLFLSLSLAAGVTLAPWLAGGGGSVAQLPRIGPDTPPRIATQTPPPADVEKIGGHENVVVSAHPVAPRPTAATIPPPPVTSGLTAGGGLGLKLVRVEGGTFSMGGDEIGTGRASRPVTLRSFYVGETEVPYEALLAYWRENDPDREPPSDALQPGGGRLPAHSISWLEAASLCNWLSRRDGRRPYYRISGKDVGVPDLLGEGYRLPTEAEMEFLLRQGNGPFPRDTVLRDVDTLPADGPHGLKGLRGSVWEMCHDWWSPALPAGPAVDPSGPATPTNGTNKVIRGGTFRKEARASERYFQEVSARGLRRRLPHRRLRAAPLKR
ncbi:MAG: SUMF1/EgtB/PvdO family nonheme iron enzyme [Isosphaeraceae bacterium]